MPKLLLYLICLIAALALAGCATPQDARETSSVLTQSGFLVQNADTPAKLAHLKSMPQRKFFKIKRQGKDWWVYADARDCKCLYVGDYEDFQEYKKLAWDHYLQTGQERYDYITGDSKTSGGWNDWGPW